MPMMTPILRTVILRKSRNDVVNIVLPCGLRRTNARFFASEPSDDAMAFVPIQEESCNPGGLWSQPQLAETIRPYFDKKQPVVLRGAVVGAKALEHWKDWTYLQQTVGDDKVCHVEVGGNYTQSQRSDIRFGDFLAYMNFFEERHGRTGSEPPPSNDLVYLAQNEVFEELEQDFRVPDFCKETSFSVGHGKLYSTMIWIGPYGCVSPLHNDPLDNVLMQFIGSKRVLMYAPDESLYAGHGGNQKNTSPIDPEKPPNLDQYPLLATLSPALECMLFPGDLLYIPKKWYHFVRTIETSISVNAWWR